MRNFVMFVIVLIITCPVFASEVGEVISPDGRIKIKIEIDDYVTYSVFYLDRQIILPSPMSMTLEGIGEIGKDAHLETTQTNKVDKMLYPVVSVKNSSLRDYYNEKVLQFEGSYSIVFRAYDDGIAYRFVTNIDGKVKVTSEQVRYNFPKGLKVYFPEEDKFVSHNECYYDHVDMKEVDGKQCILPVLVEMTDGVKMLITEADIEDYPGLYLYGSAGTSFIGRHPAYVLKYSLDKRYRRSIIEKRADYLAETSGKRAFSWRAVVIAKDDSDLLLNELVYKLGKPQEIQDTSWIKPGKVAWDWYNANNIYGVDFRAGINTDTYKYYIDFASKYHLEYIIVDDGWYLEEDLSKINPDMDMDEIFRYAKEKNVGIVLWVGWKSFEDKFDECMQQFQDWGAAGIKVDFMQRDDQGMVNYYYKVAKEAAKRHMLVDFHGSYKPDGMRRTYPNVITREGLRGLENCKWSDLVTPDHCLTLPFIRMVAGPMDFTPGAMNNAQKDNFRKIFTRPMSQGTRCLQLAMYVVYESPLQMLTDNPSNYLREPEIMDFLSKVPTVWDETRVIEAKISDYIVMARRKGDDWYVAAMTDWTSREFEVDLSFLGKKTYQADVYQDGINADRYASDYKRIKMNITRKDGLKIKLAPGGGYVAVITEIGNK
ncbi:MAG: glycoside hydrolase family 97 protein [Sedimentisphaerales bacterium]|nr:glycoside hydrolase family 97 protein [Sedimentisphaerales bacterium]